jgi:hypothetical protein
MSHWKRMLLRTALCGATALTPLAAFSADKAADDAGTKTITDFVAAYLGKATLPTIKITPSGSSYLVSLDLASATQGLKSAGITYDPAVLQFKVFQQDDGAWRVETDGIPPIASHFTPKDDKGAKVDMHLETTNAKGVTVLDPKLNWFASGSGSLDKLSVTERGPGIEEFFELAGVKADMTTTSGPSGLVSTIKEPLASFNLVLDVDPKGVDHETGEPRKPVHVSAQGTGGVADVKIADFQPGPILDAWRFAVAHPERADVARDFAALKPVMTALAANHLTAGETVKVDKVNVMTEVGPVAIEGADVGFGIVNNGADTGFSEHVAARSIKLPGGLVPDIYAPILPTSFDIGFRAHGFDVEAATAEWLADAKPDGDGPMFSKEDQDKVSAKLVAGRPIVIDIQPSHIKGPSLDLAFQGKVTIDKSKRTGAITLTVRDFDKMAEAVQGLGQEASQRLTPVIAMAKGLGKASQDGALVWECSIGPDHVMKVNGLPLGKAPF